MRSTVIVPAYQPDEKLNALAKALAAEGFDVVVVDDGSGEGYRALFEKASHDGAKILRHSTNCGKGRAIKTALDYLLAHRPDIGCAIIADADGQHSVTDIKAVAKAQREHADAVILGVRPISAMPPRSRAGNTLARFLFRLQTGIWVSDTQTGLRGIPGKLFEAMAQIKGERYEYEINMLFFIKREGIRLCEIPIEAIYLNGNRSSHFRPLCDTLRILEQFLIFSCSALLCAGVDYALFALTAGLSLPLPACYALARIASGTLNFSLNRAAVFHARLAFGCAAKYALLVISNILAGALIVEALAGVAGASLVAKLIADVCLFGANYYIQRKFVFI